METISYNVSMCLLCETAALQFECFVLCLMGITDYHSSHSLIVYLFLSCDFFSHSLFSFRPAGGRTTWTATACDLISYYLTGAPAVMTIKVFLSPYSCFFLLLLLLFFPNTSFIPLSVGLGDPSDLAPLIGGLLFLFGFTSQGGTTILPPSRTIASTHKHLNYSFSVYMCERKYTQM